jgi:hypothetical protein
VSQVADDRDLVRATVDALSINPTRCRQLAQWLAAHGGNPEVRLVTVKLVQNGLGWWAWVYDHRERRQVLPVPQGSWPSWVHPGPGTQDTAPPGCMSLEEFRAGGYLTEVNRQVLHPLGLAMAVEPGPDGHLVFAGIIDHRDDPEGVYYGDPWHALGKALKVLQVSEERRQARVAALGYWVQPLPGQDPDEDAEGVGGCLPLEP